MSRRVLAVESGPGFLHAARLRRGWRGSVLEGVFCRELPPAPPGQESEEGAEAWEELRGAFRRWDEGFGRADLTVAALGGTDVFPVRLRMPFRRVSQIARVIKAEVEDEIPLALEEVVVDFVLAAPPGADGLEVFAVAVPKGALALHLEALARLGVDPDRVVFSPLADLRAVLVLAPEAAAEEVGLVRVGPDHVTLMRAEKGYPRQFRVFRPAGHRPGAGGGALDDAGAEALVRELTLTLRSWSTSDKEAAGLSGLILTGAGDLAALGRRVQEAIGLPARPLAWAGRRGLAAKTAPLPDALRRASAALGAALPPPGLLERGFDLRREEFARREGWRELRRPLLAAGASLVLLGAVGVGDLVLKVRSEERRLEALNRRIERSLQGVLPGGRDGANLEQRLTTLVAGNGRRIRFLLGDGGEGSEPLDVLERISEAIPSSLPVRLNRLDIDGQGVSLEGETRDFETVDRIKLGLLRKAGFEGIEVRNARLIQGRAGVRFQMRLRRGGAGEEGRR